MFTFYYTVSGMDFILPSPKSFDVGSGSGSNITFDVTVNSDDFIEWNESIVINLMNPGKSNVLFTNSQVTTTVTDVDGMYLVAPLLYEDFHINYWLMFKIIRMDIKYNYMSYCESLYNIGLACM